MVGDWLAIAANLARKREVLIMASELKIHRHQVVGRLIEFWCWAQTQTEDGMLPGLTIELLSHENTDLGPPFFNAMVHVNWLVECPDGIKIPEYEVWMGCAAKSRRLATRRQRNRRHNRANDTAPVTLGP